MTPPARRAALFVIVHIAAPNDPNGNPQRAYVVCDATDGRVVWVFDEGHVGPSAVPASIRTRAVELPRIAVAAAEYHAWLRVGRQAQTQEVPA